MLFPWHISDRLQLPPTDPFSPSLFWSIWFCWDFSLLPSWAGRAYRGMFLKSALLFKISSSKRKSCWRNAEWFKSQLLSPRQQWQWQLVARTSRRKDKTRQNTRLPLPSQEILLNKSGKSNSTTWLIRCKLCTSLGETIPALSASNTWSVCLSCLRFTSPWAPTSVEAYRSGTSTWPASSSKLRLLSPDWRETHKVKNQFCHRHKPRLTRILAPRASSRS